MGDEVIGERKRHGALYHRLLVLSQLLWLEKRAGKPGARIAAEPVVVARHGPEEKPLDRRQEDGLRIVRDAYLLSW